MLAISLAIALFLFLTFLGKAILEAIRFHSSSLRGWLLSPCIGFASLILLILNLNQLGLPVRSFALWLTLSLLMFIGVVFWWRRPIIPWKQLAPFEAIALGSLLYSCWPMFLYGLGWVGYMNGDMGMYCLGAVRAMNYGFYRVPTLAELNSTDYTQYMWFLYAAGSFRCGSDLFLGWFASLTHMAPLRISMPVLGCLNLAQLQAGAALVLFRPHRRRLALLTACLLSASPFFINGIVTQVLPQVGGIALLLGLCSLAMRTLPRDATRSELLKTAALSAIVGAALCIDYPEVLPFACLALAGFHIYALLRRAHSPVPFVVFVASLAIALALIVRQGIVTAIGTVIFALAAGVRSGPALPTQFDTILDPGLFAALFGFRPYVGIRIDPWISMAILAGMALLVLTVLTCFRAAVNLQPYAFLLLGMLGVGTHLFFSHSAFGLFKLAMYIQPVLLVPMAALSLRLRGARSYLVPVVYAVATFATAKWYVAASTELGSESAVTLPGLSKSTIHPLKLPTRQLVLMNPPNVVGATVYSAYSVGTAVTWADFQYMIGATQKDVIPPALLAIPSKVGLTRDYTTYAAAFRRYFQKSWTTTSTILGHQVPYRNAPGTAAVAYLGHLTHDPWHSSNNTCCHGTDHNYFVFEPINSIRNHLVLLTSDKGGPFGPASRASRWPVEADYYLPGGKFYAVGRYLLFEVLNPTPNLRLRVSMSRTQAGYGRTLLPSAASIDGADRENLAFVGAGAANIFSPPLHLLARDGHSYFAVDFGMEGTLFPDHKTGLLWLFNRDIKPDIRQVIGLTRDIALMAEADYRTLRRPRAIKSFPADLLNDPGLEFSGIYEDGWISDRAFITLGSSAAGDKLEILGELPHLGRFAKSGNGLKILLNGKYIHQERLTTGYFHITHNIANATEVNRIDFVFDRMEALPNGDDRPVAARITRIRLTKPESVRTVVPISARANFRQ